MRIMIVRPAIKIGLSIVVMVESDRGIAGIMDDKTGLVTVAAKEKEKNVVCLV